MTSETKLPPSFVIMMNDEKESRRNAAIEYLIKETGLSELFKEADNEEKINFRNFMEKIYDIGFYEGVDFILDFNIDDYEEHHMTDGEKYDMLSQSGNPLDVIDL